jgi:hypothetical protein
VKPPGHEADNSPSTNAYAKTEGSYTSTPISLRGVILLIKQGMQIIDSISRHTVLTFGLRKSSGSLPLGMPGMTWEDDTKTDNEL